MDIPSTSLCRGGNTSLDSMDLMGTILSGIAYGVVFVICTHVLCTSSPPCVPKLSWRTFMTCWLFLLSTITTVLQIKWTQFAFVTQQEVSPSVFIEENISNWNYVLLNALYVIINWSADGILVFRFSCVFNRALQWNIFPVLLYLSSLVTGSLALHELATPGTSQDTNRLTNWLVIYRTVSLSLCIILTSLITGRLIAVHRRSCSRPSRPNSPLMDVAIMLVESASLETVSTLAYVITVGIGSPVQNVFLPILGQVQVIAPMLIIYRVVRSRDSMAELPKHHDMTQPTLSLRINTATHFSTLPCMISASPTRSSRGFESLHYSLPPPYALEHTIGIVPPSPSAVPAHMSGVQILGMKPPIWS